MTTTLTGLVTTTDTTTGQVTLANGNIDVVGGISAQGAVSLTGATTLSGGITTTGDNIGLNSATTLAGNVLLSTGAGVGGNISFANTLDDTVAGTHTLGLTAGTGTVTFTGVVGGTALGAVTINSAQRVTITTADSTLISGFHRHW